MSDPIQLPTERKLTGAELEFFEKVTTEMVRLAGKRRNHFKTYRLVLNRGGFENLVRAMRKCGGTLEVPEFDPTYKERE